MATAEFLEAFTERAETIWKDVRLSFEEDGVYLVLPLNWARVSVTDDVFIQQFVECSNAVDVDINGALRGARSGMRMNRIAPAQPVAVARGGMVPVLTRDNLMAGLVLLPPGQNGARLTTAEIEKTIRVKNNITVGIDTEAIEQALTSETYFKAFLAAQGVLPQVGEDAYLVFHFEREKTRAPLANEEDGKVNYHELNLFENVSKDQLLIEKIPATTGVGGLALDGSVLPAKPGKDLVLPGGKNVQASTDKLKLFSTMDGRVEYINRRVMVSNVLQIQTDVNMTVGNIDFNGDVVVNGSVISGMTIKAAGSIQVFGNVEAATLEAGGSIVLHRGIQGGGNGVLKANASIVSRFIERSRVICAGNITADSILHSNVSCAETLLCKGKRGLIVGGNVRAGAAITAVNIGSDVAVTTRVEVGVAPETRERIIELDSEIKRLNIELEKCAQLARNLGNVNLDSVKRVQLRMQTTQMKRENEEALESATEERAQLSQLIEEASRGTVNVRGEVLPGTIISIGAATYTITSPIQYAAFRLVNKQVTFGVYDAVE